MVDIKKLEDAMKSYENVRESITGLHEIINIKISKKDFFYEAAIDNLKALNENIIKILKQSNPPREVRMRLRELKFDEIDAEKNFPL